MTSINFEVIGFTPPAFEKLRSETPDLPKQETDAQLIKPSHLVPLESVPGSRTTHCADIHLIESKLGEITLLHSLIQTLILGYPQTKTFEATYKMKEAVSVTVQDVEGVSEHQVACRWGTCTALLHPLDEGVLLNLPICGQAKGRPWWTREGKVMMGDIRAYHKR